MDVDEYEALWGPGNSLIKVGVPSRKRWYGSWRCYIMAHERRGMVSSAKALVNLRSPKVIIVKEKLQRGLW